MKGISVNHIQDETITKVGIDFFKYFAQNISQVLKLPIIVITEKIPEKDMVSTLAIWDSTKFRQNKKYNIINSPCEIVSKGYVSVYTEKVCENFPYDMNIKELSVESYIGIPLLGENREFLGHIAAMDRKPITNPGMIIETLKLFAERAVFEISAKKFQEDIKEFFNITEEIMIILDLKGKIRKISPSVEIQLGYLPGEMIFKNLLDYVPEENKKKGKEEFSNFLKHNDTLDFASPLRRKDGSWNWLQWRAVFNRKKKLIYVSGRNINDKIEKIKDKKHAEELLNQFFNLSQDIMCMANLEGYFTKVNPALENFLGLDKEKILGTSFFNFIHPDDIEPTIFIISELKKGKKTVGFENRYLARGNKYKWLSWNAVYNCDDNLIYATARDVSKTKEIHEKLQIQASYDPLTGLINRRGFEIKIQNEISRANRYNHPFSIFMIDIDNFKRINDSLGHSSGDFVLRKFAQILKLSIRNTDYAARYGGEEFIAILPETNLEKAFELAERVRKNIYKNSIYFKDNLKERISISIGVATFPKHGGTRKEIIDSADAAMYIAKRKGKNRTEIAFGDCDFEE